jgi:hypothetical protein
MIYLFAHIAYFLSSLFRHSLFEKIQDYEKTLSNSKREARQVTLAHISLHALILLPKPHNVGIQVSYLVSYA